MHLIGAASLDLSQGTGVTYTSVFNDFTGVGSLTKSGTGTINLTGDVQMAVQVNGGTVLANNFVQFAEVSAGATLGGVGVIGGGAILAGGTLSPGDPGGGITILAPSSPIGVLTFSGDLDFAADSFYRVEVSPSDADRTDVAGTATLAGTVQAVFEPGTYLERDYTILTSTSRSGEFEDLTTQNLPAGFDAALAYDGNDVLLQLTAQLGLSGNFPSNQQSVANALNTFFNDGGTLPPGFVTLFGLTGDQLLQALSQTSGEAGSSSLSQSTFMAMNQFLGAMMGGGGSGGFGGGGALAYAAAAGPRQPDAVREAYAAVTPRGAPVYKAPAYKAAPYADPYAPRWRVWGSAYGGSADIGGDAGIGSHDTTHRAYGFAVGADHMLTPDTRIGFALAGGGTNFSIDQGLGGGRSDLFQAGLHARHQMGAAYLSAGLAYGWQDVSTERNVFTAGFERLEADFNAHAFSGRAEGGWRFGGLVPSG